MKSWLGVRWPAWRLFPVCSAARAHSRRESEETKPKVILLTESETVMVRFIVLFVSCAMCIGQFSVAYAAGASAGGSGPLPVGGSITLNFQTSVQAQGKTTTATGAVKITHASATTVSVTLAPAGGEAETLDLALASDGT